MTRPLPDPPARPTHVRGDCRHCGRGVWSKLYMLCYRCFYDMTVRDMYDPVPMRKVVGLFCDRGVLPEPTNAQPGSEQKIVVLAERCEQNLPLWHPLDYDPRKEG